MICLIPAVISALCCVGFIVYGLSVRKRAALGSRLLAACNGCYETAYVACQRAEDYNAQTDAMIARGMRLLREKGEVK